MKEKYGWNNLILISRSNPIFISKAISPFSTMFFMQFVFQNPVKATFQFSSAASLNLGWSENGVLGNGLIFVSGCQ